MTEVTTKIILDDIGSNIDNIESSSDWHYVKGMLDIAWTAGIISQEDRLALSREADRKLRQVCSEDEVYDTLEA